jgi:hypothetical protein
VLLACPICPNSRRGVNIACLLGDSLHGMSSDDRVTSRRRRSRDEVLKTNQRIIRLFKRGDSVRVISRAVDMPRMSVYRVIKAYQRAQEQTARTKSNNVPFDTDTDGDDESEFDAELDLFAAQLDVFTIDDVKSPEDIHRLNALELFRAGYAPESHPVHGFITEAVDRLGWRWPEPPGRDEFSAQGYG